MSGGTVTSDSKGLYLVQPALLESLQAQLSQVVSIAFTPIAHNDLATLCLNILKFLYLGSIYHTANYRRRILQD